MEQRLTRQESKTRTRSSLLEAGTQLLRDKPVGNVTSHIRPQDVVRIAGVSTGAFYHHWSSQSDYIQDLLDHVLAPDRFEGLADHTRQAVQQAIDSGASLADVVTAGTAANLKALLDDPFYDLQMSLWAAARNDPELRERLGTLYRERMARYTPFYEQLFAAYGLQLKPEVTIQQFAALISALAEGLALRYGADQNAPSDLGDGAQLFATAAMQLLTTMTEPAPGTP